MVHGRFQAPAALHHELKKMPDSTASEDHDLKYLQSVFRLSSDQTSEALEVLVLMQPRFAWKAGYCRSDFRIRSFSAKLLLSLARSQLLLLEALEIEKERHVCRSLKAVHLRILSCCIVRPVIV